jgi:hypothetical protein
VVLQDTDGKGIATMDMSVKLSNRKLLKIAPGIPAHLTLDFDLDASNEADITPVPPVVTVEPLLIAEVNPDRPKIHRVRGPLHSVDLDEDAFHVLIRPFHHRRGDCGPLTVLVDEETVYEIDGQPFTGKEGLKALDEKPFGTALIAIGTLNMAMRRFQAAEVYGGSSVPGGDLDVVSGNVTARSGDSLTLLGATLIRTDGTMVFHDHVTILLGPDTKVLGSGVSSEELSIDDISVGQRLRVFGMLLNDQPEALELDATEGLVRMHLTSLAGEVVAADPGTLIVTLQSIDRRKISLFDFFGTGIDRSNDADPFSYEVNTGSLDLTELFPTDPVKVRGFVMPYGQAPQDFDARTVIDVSSMKSHLHISWLEDGTPAPFESLSTDHLVVRLDADETGLFHHVMRAGVFTDLFELNAFPKIESMSSEPGLFAVCQKGAVTIYTDFEDYVLALEESLDGQSSVRDIWTKGGRFSNESVTMTDAKVIIKFDD